MSPAGGGGVPFSLQLFFHLSEWTDEQPLAVGAEVSFTVAERLGKYNGIRLLPLAPGTVTLEVGGDRRPAQAVRSQGV